MHIPAIPVSFLTVIHIYGHFVLYVYYKGEFEVAVSTFLLDQHILLISLL